MPGYDEPVLVVPASNAHRVETPLRRMRKRWNEVGRNFGIAGRIIVDALVAKK